MGAGQRAELVWVERQAGHANGCSAGVAMATGESWRCSVVVEARVALDRALFFCKAGACTALFMAVHDGLVGGWSRGCGSARSPNRIRRALGGKPRSATRETTWHLGSVGGSWTGGSELDNSPLGPSQHFFSVPRASLLIRAWTSPRQQPRSDHGAARNGAETAGAPARLQPSQAPALSDCCPLRPSRRPASQIC